MVLAALGLVLAMATPAGADTSSASLTNQAIVQITGTHQNSHDLAWSLAQVDQSSVTASNEASATATNCLTCTAEAVAFQIVLASNTNTFVLTNNATSINTNCVNCTTVSVAEQWVIGDTGRSLRLNFIGQLELFAIHLQLAFWSHVPPVQGLSHILALATEVSTILANDVVEVPSPKLAPVSPAVSPKALATPAPIGPTIQHYAQVNTG